MAKRLGALLSVIFATFGFAGDTRHEKVSCRVVFWPAVAITSSNGLASVLTWCGLIRRRNMETVISYLTAIISAASIIAAVTPTPKDDSFIAKIYRLVDLLAINIGKAKDK